VPDAIKMNSERQSQPSHAARSDCFHSRLRASCQKCGRITQILHLPMKLLGRYCPNCCPVCSGLEPPQ
jgi:hypothetical protein